MELKVCVCVCCCGVPVVCWCALASNDFAYLSILEVLQDVACLDLLSVVATNKPY